MNSRHVQKPIHGRETVDTDFNKIGISKLVDLVPNHFWLEIHERSLLCLEGEIQEKYMFTSRSNLKFRRLIVAQGQHNITEN